MLGCGASKAPPPASPKPAVSAAPKPAAPKAALASHEAMLALIDQFLESPFEAPDDAADQIKKFATDSHDVTISVTPDIAVFLGEDLHEEVKQLLLVGLLAGNAGEQLRRGVKGDERYAGVVGEVRVYRRLRAAAPKLKDYKLSSPWLEQLIALEEGGELRDFVEHPEGKSLAERVQRIATATAADVPKRGAVLSHDDIRKRLNDAQDLMKANKHREALAYNIDPVLASYAQEYASETRSIFCANGQAETLSYLTGAAHDGRQAIALDMMWANAWFLRSYALTELKRVPEARRALHRALALSPGHADYLSELGYQYQGDKDWLRSMELYRRAEASVGLIEDEDMRRRQHARSLRGQGYAFGEMGKLDEGEAKYRESLKLDPDSSIAKNEIEYLHRLRK